MVSRRDLKSAHEDSVLHGFGVHLGRAGVNFLIVERPDPPDALVELSGERTWIEISDAFLDERHAIGLTTLASDDVEHISDSGRLIVSPDEIFSEVIHSIIATKCDKESMLKCSERHGKGILLVGIFSPFTTAEAVAISESSEVEKIVTSRAVQVFRTIYAYDGVGSRNFYVLYESRA